MMRPNMRQLESLKKNMAQKQEEECCRITPQIIEIIDNILESSSSSEISIHNHSCQMEICTKQNVETENQALSTATKEIIQNLCYYTSGETCEESMICSYCSKRLESKQSVDFNYPTSNEFSEYYVQKEINNKSRVSLEKSYYSEFASMDMGKQKKNGEYHTTQSETFTHPKKLQGLQKNQRKNQLKFEKKASGHGIKNSFQDPKHNLPSQTQHKWLKCKAHEAIRKRKIFMAYGRYAEDIRKCLLNRGWVEKLPPHYLVSKLNLKLNKSRQETLLLSSFLENHHPNFIWAGRINRPFNSYQDGLISNRHQHHTNGNGNKKMHRNDDTIVSRLKANVKFWSSKSGLCTSLKGTSWYYIKDIAEVYVPRTYINTDRDDLIDFVNDYLLTACISLLRWILDNLQNGNPVFRSTGQISVNVMIFALNRCKEYLNKKENKDIDGKIRTLTSPGQWNSFMIKHQSLTAGQNVFKLDSERNITLLTVYAHYLLKKISRHRPQLKCEGYHNVWIIKPSNSSMGTGIRISSDLHRILNMITKTKSKYVVQKYIEAPFLIYETKFDIRQYFLITSTYPLEIWMYKDCFLKFCSQNYTLKSYHESIHLTNQAIQKHYTNSYDRNPGLPIKNICGLNSFKNYLKYIEKEGFWDEVIYPGMKKTIVGIMLTSQEALANDKNRFGLYGCDFILDNDLRPWLIEINNFPDLGPSYKAKLCNKVLKDIIKVVIDHAKNPKASTGRFECVYRQLTTSYQITDGRAKTLEVKGTAVPLHLQLHGKLLDKAPAVLASRGSNLNIFSELDPEYISLNVMKQSVNNIPSSLKQDNSRDAFITYTETKAKAEQDNNSSFNLIFKEPCGDFERVELNVMAESDKGNNLVFDQDKMICPYVTDTEPNMLKPIKGSQLDGNKEKQNRTYTTESKLNSLVELKKISMTSLNTYSDRKNTIIRNPYVTQIESKTVTNLGWQHFNLNTDKDIGFYATNVKTNIRRKPYDYMDLNSKRELCTHKTCSKSNPVAELHNTDHWKFDKDKGEPNIIAELDNNIHLDLIPEDSKMSDASNKTQRDINACPYPNNDNHLQFNPGMETCANKTHIVPNAKAEPNNYDYLNLIPEKEIGTYLTFIEPTALVKQDNVDDFDFNQKNDKKAGTYIVHIESNTMLELDNDDICYLDSRKERCNFLTHKEPNIIAKLNDGDHLHINLGAEMCSYMPHSEPNIMTDPNNNNYLNFNRDKDKCSYLIETKLNATEVSDNSDFNLKDKDFGAHIKHAESNVLKELDSDDHLNLNPAKEMCAYMKQIELDQMTQSNKFYVTPSMAHVWFALWVIYMGLGHEVSV